MRAIEWASILRAPVYHLVSGSIVVQWSASVGGSQGMHHSTRIHAKSADRTSSQFRPARRKSICARACLSVNVINRPTERLGERGPPRISMRSATRLPAICFDPVTHCCFGTLSHVAHGPPSNLVGRPHIIFPWLCGTLVSSSNQPAETVDVEEQRWDVFNSLAQQERRVRAKSLNGQFYITISMYML